MLMCLRKLSSFKSMSIVFSWLAIMGGKAICIFPFLEAKCFYKLVGNACLDSSRISLSLSLSLFLSLGISILVKYVFVCFLFFL